MLPHQFVAVARSGANDSGRSEAKGRERSFLRPAKDNPKEPTLVAPISTHEIHGHLERVDRKLENG